MIVVARPGIEERDQCARIRLQTLIRAHNLCYGPLGSNAVGLPM